jgi:predicted dienelactone hydrolase
VGQRMQRTSVWLLGGALAAAAAGQTTSAPASVPATQSAPASQAASTPYKLDAAAAYKLEEGPFNVSLVENLTLEDKARKTKLPILIRYPRVVAASMPAERDSAADPKAAVRAKKRTPPPEESGPLPLVIFSHGAGGSSDAFEELSRHWAGHGYVVIHPTHSDSLQLRRSQGEDLSGVRADPQRLRSDVKPFERVADIKLILDQLDWIEQNVNGLRSLDGKPRIDRGRIAMAGHSAGALTTQMIFGAHVRGERLAGQSGPPADARIQAAIVISGQGLSNRMFTRDSWNDLRRPMLVITGSQDVAKISNETPATRRHPYEYAPPGDKYLLFIEGATHASYQGRKHLRLLGENPATPIDVITGAVASSTLAFLDAYLKQVPAAREYLRSSGLEKMTGGAAKLDRK